MGLEMVGVATSIYVRKDQEEIGYVPTSIR